MIKHLLQKAYNFNLLKICCIKGFTLAEVLVTLTIMGVLAVLTIPGIVDSKNKAQYVSKLKKEFSVLSQAFMLIQADAGGSILNSSLSSSVGDAAADASAMNEFAMRINIIKNCGNGIGCWYPSPLKFLGGITSWYNNMETSWSGNFGKAIFADGTSILIDINGSSCTANFGSSGTPTANSVCGYIYIDINGSIAPNTLGRDVFTFYITRTGIYPRGIFRDGTSCELDSSTHSTSYGCTGKVLTEGAMNY